MPIKGGLRNAETMCERFGCDVFGFGLADQADERSENFQFALGAGFSFTFLPTFPEKCINKLL